MDTKTIDVGIQKNRSYYMEIKTGDVDMQKDTSYYVDTKTKKNADLLAKPGMERVDVRSKEWTSEIPVFRSLSKA